MTGIRWTEAEDADMRELYPTTKNSELAAILNARHGNGRNERSVNSRAHVMGLRKAEGYRHPMPIRFWTDERRDWFVAFVPGHTESEISAEHERLFGTPLTEGQIGGGKAKFGVKSGTHGGRFEKGRRTWNKGIRQTDYMSPEAIERTKATRFQKGGMPHNAEGKPVGCERVDSRDGYVWVKVAERPSRKDCNDNWQQKHRLVYEQAYGYIPTGCNVVFADHDNRNFNPANLVAVPRELWSIIIRAGMSYHDADSLRACMALAKLRLAISAAEKRQRPCRACGVVFEPRYAGQRRCDACLGRVGETGGAT